jgi:hypothetical protein
MSTGQSPNPAAIEAIKKKDVHFGRAGVVQ